MIYILVDSGYANSIWCHKRLEDLTNQLKSRRSSYRVVDSIEEISAHAFHVFLIGMDRVWIEGMIRSFNAMNICPIWLCNMSQYQVPGDYSIVCMDMVRSMSKLVKVLERSGRKNIGLYGINPYSTADQGKYQGFLAATEGKKDRWFFYNDGDLAKCFSDFMALGSQVDTMICCNNYAAISLVRHLKQQAPQRLEHMMIVSDADAVLAGLYSEYITLVRNCADEFGKAAVALLDTLKKMPKGTVASVNLQWDVDTLEIQSSGCETPQKHFPVITPASQSRFYADEEVRKMMRIEQLLSFGSNVDKAILYGLRKGKNYGQIAEECFLSINTVKYHVKKMIVKAGVENKRQFVDLINAYLPEEKIDAI